MDQIEQNADQYIMFAELERDQQTGSSIETFDAYINKMREKSCKILQNTTKIWLKLWKRNSSITGTSHCHR